MEESRYEQARQAFNELDWENKLTFLLTESFSTMIGVLESVATTIQKDCSTIFGAEKEASSEEPEDVA